MAPEGTIIAVGRPTQIGFQATETGERRGHARQGREAEPQVTQRAVPDRRRDQPAPAQRALKVEPQRVRIVLRTVAREHGGRRQASTPQRDRDPFAGEGGNHCRLVADPVQPVGGDVIGT